MTGAGQMRHCGYIQQATRTKNEIGENVVTWADWKRIDLKITALRGDKREDIRQISPEASHLIKCRYLPTIKITEANRIRIRDGIYNIKFVDNVMLMNKDLEIHVEQQRGSFGDKTGN